MYPRLALLFILLVGSSCTCTDTVIISPSDSGTSVDAGGRRDAGPMPVADGGALDAGARFDAGPTACLDGDPCGDGGVCAGGSCCSSGAVCGSACCGAGTLCSFDRCVAPGALCREASDCPSAQFCDFSAVRAQDAGSVTGASDAGQCVGSTAKTGRCLPRPPVCAVDGGGLGAGVSCVESCRFTPTGAAFSPVVKYSWGNHVTAPFDTDVMMSPIVTQLDDDNCDGVVGPTDRPDIVFTTFASGQYNTVGTIHAISVKNGALVQSWEISGLMLPGAHLASGNIDGVAGNEVVGCGPAGATALRSDGTTLWASTFSCNAPSVADVDGDGLVEVITEYAQLVGSTGMLKFAHAVSLTDPVVADIDGDGARDLVSGMRAVKADGTVLADTSLPSNFTAVVDLDLDGMPEIVGIRYETHRLHVWRYDAAEPGKAKIIRSGVDINGTLDPARCPPGSAGNIYGGGPLTAGDFNHDGVPDIALAGGVGYAVIDGKKLMNAAVANPDVFLWTRATQDCSSAATGSSLFDFDGDGRTEAVYADEVQLHIYDSATGNDRFTTCNTSGTLSEYPLVADVDNDGQADLVVVSNAYAFTCPGTSTGVSGVRVFSSSASDWVVTRRVWNQHAYSITNIEEDGTVPRVSASNWLQPGLNNFRQQKQPGFEFAAPDAVVTLQPACEVDASVRAVVRNLGEAPLAAGVLVEVVKANGLLLGTVMTQRTLGSAQSEAMVLRLTDEEVLNQTSKVYARITAGVLRECRAGNNASQPITLSCVN